MSAEIVRWQLDKLISSLIEIREQNNDILLALALEDGRTPLYQLLKRIAIKNGWILTDPLQPPGLPLGAGETTSPPLKRRKRRLSSTNLPELEDPMEVSSPTQPANHDRETLNSS